MTLKDDVLKDYGYFVTWLKQLNRSKLEKHWLLPIAEGKWSVAAVISHMKNWDNFIIENRLKPILNQMPFPIVKVDPDEVNQKARDYAHSGVSQEQLIKEVIEERQKVLSLLDQLSNEQFEIPYKIGSNEVTISAYISGLAEHDRHHMKQVEEVLG